MNDNYKYIKSFKYFLIVCLIFLIVPLFYVGAATYTPTTDKTTNLGHNVVMHETKGEFRGSQYISYVNFNPVTNKTIKLVPWAILNSSTQTNTRSTVLNIAKDYEAKNPGSKVIAGINADFFPFLSTNENPFSAQVIEGDVHQANVFSIAEGGVNYPANVLGIMSDGSLKSSHIVSATQAIYLDIFGENKEVLYSTQVTGFNTTPGNNQTSAYFGTSHTQVVTGTKVYYVAKPSFIRDNSKFARGVISEVTPSITLDSRSFAIVTKDANVEKYLEKGVEIRVTKRVSGDLEGIESAVGFYGHPLKNGVVAPYGAYPNGLGGSRTQSTWTSLQPRTMLGVKADGTVIMGIVEGRTAGKTGLSAQGVGEFLQSFGCVEGYMFDGGGSSTLIATVNGTLKVVAMGTTETRSIVNALLLVEQITDPFELQPKFEEVKHDSFKISVNPVLPTGFEIVKIEAIVNGITKLIDGKELLIEGANVNSSNSIRFKVTYKDNGVEKQFTALKSYNVQTIAMPPEVIVEVSEITKDTITLIVSLKNNGSEILESYFLFNDKPTILPSGDDNIIKFIDLDPDTVYKYSALVKYINDDSGAKYYNLPIAEVKTEAAPPIEEPIDEEDEEKPKSGCMANQRQLVIILGGLGLLIFFRRRKH